MSFEELKEVFVDTLNCDADKVTMEASLTEDLQADSLDAVELNMAFEDKFGITIADEAWERSRLWVISSTIWLRGQPKGY